jgi:hypothetical protein
VLYKWVIGGKSGHHTDPAHSGSRLILRVGDKRPRKTNAAKKRNELPTLHSITLSAGARNAGGTVKSSALALLRLYALHGLEATHPQCETRVARMGRTEPQTKRVSHVNPSTDYYRKHRFAHAVTVRHSNFSLEANRVDLNASRINPCFCMTSRAAVRAGTTAGELPINP